MSRSLNNSWCLFLLSALTAALLWLAPMRDARAAVYTYSARQRTINAGVLFVGSAASNAPDPAPYVFYVLDQRADVKPVGWTFVNPLAVSEVSTAMSARRPAYTAGTALTRTMAAYWEVPLRDVSADDLQQFDVLYLSASGVGFLPSDNEKLRRFVDNGGLLFVEYASGAGTPGLFTGTSWATGSDPTLTPPVPSLGVSDLHPLLVLPNLFLASDLPFLGTPSSPGVYGSIASLSGSDYGNLFGPVLYHSSASFHAMDAAQLGGGQIVTSTLNIGPAVSRLAVATLPLSFNPAVVPAANLKLLSNAISWADTHPTENKTSHQNASGPSSASFASAWAYPDPAQNTPLTGATPPPGPVVWGNYVYVTDAAGILHAFDAVPAEAVTGGTSADDGAADFISATPTPYDEVWRQAVGANASAPTVASFGGTTYVFVERANGSVVQYNSVTGAPGSTLTPASAGSTVFPQGTTVNAPAPTYYDGRIYASQPDGTLFIYSLNGLGSAATGAVIPVNPQNNVTGEYPTGSPAVGLLQGGLITNTIVAYVPTTQNMNTVLLGARNDPLVSYSPNGNFAGYNVNRTARYNLFNLYVDPASSPVGLVYDSGGNLLGNASTGAGRDPAFPSTTAPINADDQFGDWDSDFVKSIPSNGGQTLTLHEIKALSLANTAGGTTIVSAPAIDRKGDYYYTVNDGTNSYLFGIHDDVQQRNVLIKFRFRLPRTGDTSTIDPLNGTQWSTAGNAFDADNVNYADTSTNPVDNSSRSLMDLHFVGAPVVDGQGNVYVAAQNQGATVAAVLAFNADQEITATPLGPTANGFAATQARYFQLDEFTGNPQNPLVAIASTSRQGARYGQITTAGSVASVFNFGRGSGGARQIAGNLCEPQPFTATPNPQSGGSATWMYFHTNMAWHTTFAVNGQISGISKAGNTLLLCDSGTGASGSFNILYKLPAAPTIGSGKLAALTVRKAPLGTGGNGKYLSIGTVAAAPSAGGGSLVINGTAGVAAFNQQLTLIADNNRILEADADGNAVWSADATTRIQNPNNPNSLKTRVDFAHPSALAQFAPNDYLVADTGNNRCVRFDRAGNVLWEMTRFYDPSGLMAPGQPFTLNHPSSVEVRRETFNYTDPITAKSLVGQIVHYLVADTGNDRIVEVTDTLDAGGNVLYFDLAGNVVAPGTAGSVTHDHLLTWVTHTGDLSGRHYHYASASYLDIPSASAATADTVEVFALVTNARIARPAVSGGPLAAASGDAPGGSIVAFNRPTNPPAFNAITAATSNDLVFVANSFTAGFGAGQRIYPTRNPRFLHVYAPPQPVPLLPANYQYSFLYADDNGAFDLVYTGPATPPASYGLAFTQGDYRNMSLVAGVSADVPGNVPFRGGAPAAGSLPAVPPIPFVPTCVQRLNDDDTNLAARSHIARYLITQSYSQGELARLPGSTAPSRLGGEIFEVDVSTNVSGAGVTVINDPVGGFAGAVTLSRPVGASPLTQPTFAIRTPQ